jgi:hypothetical protein
MVHVRLGVNLREIIERNVNEAAHIIRAELIPVTQAYLREIMYTIDRM